MKGISRTNANANYRANQSNVKSTVKSTRDFDKGTSKNV